MLRILTYNAHRCIGSDRVTSPERIADVIAQGMPDIVALQEVDVRRTRTGMVDQAEGIARALGMRFHFNTVLRVEDTGGYGDVIMTALPARLVKAARLPGSRPRIPVVPRRGALWVCVEVDGRPIQVVTTHLGLTAPERRVQLDALFGKQWLGHPACTDPVVLLGDFNAVPRSRAYRRIAGRMEDAQVNAGRRPQPTFPARLPVLAIDHIFLSPEMKVTDVEVIRGRTARIASDHLPLVASTEL